MASDAALTAVDVPLIAAVSVGVEICPPITVTTSAWLFLAIGAINKAATDNGMPKICFRQRGLDNQVGLRFFVTALFIMKFLLWYNVYYTLFCITKFSNPMQHKNSEIKGVPIHAHWLSNLPDALQQTFRKMDELDSQWAALENSPLVRVADQWMTLLDTHPDIADALAECLEEDPLNAKNVVYAAAWLKSSQSLHMLSSLPDKVLIVIANAINKHDGVAMGVEVELMETRVTAIAANCMRSAIFSQRNIETVQRIIRKIKA